jgi:hypothetical protein
MKRQKWFRRMRPYVGRHLLGIGTAAVVVVTLCVGWPVYHGVAQTNDAPTDASLTVGQCIGANATTIDPLEETLIKEDVIEENLLQSKVTNGMCEDMLAPISDGTPAQKLLTAQNYMQEINLIERSMRKAAAEEAATRGPDWSSSSEESLIRFRTIAQTSKQVPALAQYDEGGGGGDNVSGGGGGGGGTEAGGIGGVEPSERQAAAAVSVGEDDDASIAERLLRKEEAAINAGASVPEAKASARCSTEVEVSDEELKKGKGLYKIKPQMPEEIQVRKTQRVGLLVLPVTKKRFEEMRQKHESINEKSTSSIGCVELVNRMKAQLVPLDLEGLRIYPRHPNDIRELSSHLDTRWGWDIYARQPGNLELLLDLRYPISREGQEFRLVPHSPVFDGVVRVTMLQSGSSEEATERPWWQRIFGGIFERISRLFGA